MPPSTLDFTKRADLTEMMDEPCSRNELRACLKDVANLNRWFLGYRPTLRWLDSLHLHKLSSPVHIVDVGSGYGDTLRRIERWAQEREVCVKLTGCDLNPDTIMIAAEASSSASRIEWMAADVFHFQSSEPIDIVISSLFTHHLDKSDVVRFLKWMEAHACLGWFINDLSRARIPYHLLYAFSRAASLHAFVQHDGPVSIERAFVPEDWRQMCAAAGLTEADVAIEGFAPARLCVGRDKQRQ
jgi:SAM-dependent methyltransferase